MTNVGLSELQSNSQPVQSSNNPSKGVKRRIVSNPTSDSNVAVAHEPKPPPKQKHKIAYTSTTNAIIISSDDEATVNNEIIFVRSTDGKTSQKKEPKKKHNVVLLCPLSQPNQPCVRCKVEKHPKGKVLRCHCGSESVTLHHGRAEGAQAHWKSGTHSFCSSSCMIFMTGLTRLLLLYHQVYVQKLLLH